MRTLFILLLAITAWCSCSQPVNNANDQAKQVGNNTMLQTFPVKCGWGYSIDVDGKKFIRQETIPVWQGSTAFKTKEQAQKVGAWVAARIQHNEAFSLTDSILNSLIRTDSTSVVSQ